MDNYIIQGYIDSQKSYVSKATLADQRRRKRAIDLYVNKKIGIEEIALILEVSTSKVKEYLGKRRLEQVEPESEEKANPREGRESSKKEKDEIGSINKGKKLTESMVNRLISERNERIKAWYAEGLAIEEVAKRENLKLDQAKEIYNSLGLSIYTQEQIREMRKQEAERKKEEKKKMAKERKRKKDKERRAKIKASKQKQEKIKEAKDSETKKTANEEVSSFEDIKRKMLELIRQRNSRKAVEVANYYLENADFLSNEEKEKLFLMVEFIEVKRKEIKSKKEKERETKKGKKSNTKER